MGLGLSVPILLSCRMATACRVQCPKGYSPPTRLGSLPGSPLVGQGDRTTRSAPSILQQEKRYLREPADKRETASVLALFQKGRQWPQTLLPFKTNFLLCGWSWPSMTFHQNHSFTCHEHGGRVDGTLPPLTLNNEGEDNFTWQESPKCRT